MGLISILFDNPLIFILIIISLIFALCVHEFSHGYIAYIYGDETAYKMGRLTLNPLAHLDPIGSMMILFIGVGYAKPVPVNPVNLRNPRKDMIKVAAAGPISNFILAFGAIFLCVILINFGVLSPYFFEVLLSGRILNDSFSLSFTYFIIINTYLGLFNLIPIYPLDGGQIFGNVIAKYNPNIFRQLNEYGPKILLAIIAISIFSQGRISIIGWVIEKPTNLIIGVFEQISQLMLFFL